MTISPTPSCDMIIDATFKEFGSPVWTLKARTLDPHKQKLRKVAIVCMKAAGYSYSEIRDAIGCKAHSSIVRFLKQAKGDGEISQLAFKILVKFKPELAAIAKPTERKHEPTPPKLDLTPF